MKRLMFLLFFPVMFNATSQTVVDYDGNIYNVEEIGTQSWLKQNLKSLHYSDGTSVPDVKAYNNDSNMAEAYGCLYSWDAAMRNSTAPMSQGVCPGGWHVPSHTEWSLLEEFLGGVAVAGGEMKETGFEHWNAPNTGATNSSGFTALPGGEYDAYYTPNKFQLIAEYAVFWTSTEISSTLARECYLAYNSAASSEYDWYKVMFYSIRCIRDVNTGTNHFQDNRLNIFPNPAQRSVCINAPGKPVCGTLTVTDLMGHILYKSEAGDISEVRINISKFPDGLYVVKLQSGQTVHCGMLSKTGD